MRRLILLLTLLLGGCTWSGTIYVNSPSGEGNVIDKDVGIETKASLTQ